MAEANTPEPILATWKVSQVLKRYPQLLEVLVAQSPRFVHLRNPVMRRVQAQLVTVAQAARVGGLDPATLVRTLNQAIGATGADHTVVAELPQTEAPPAFWQTPVAVDLDVRDYQARGEEPFSAIMSAIPRVPVGQALRLRNTFEPLPLYEVLAKRRFTHAARQLGPQDWEILFVRMPGDAPIASATKSDLPESTAQPVEDGAFPREWGSPTQVVTIDVSELVPPEPMVRILDAMAALPPDQTLLVRHARRPVYLYPRLEELGYQHRTRDLGLGAVEILIHKPAET